LNDNELEVNLKYIFFKYYLIYLFQLGTFTISNLGMYGVTNFSGVIYPEQVNFQNL
jgi:hypothetical protein